MTNERDNFVDKHRLRLMSFPAFIIPDHFLIIRFVRIFAPYGHSDIKTTMNYAHLEQRDVSSRARDVINKINTQIEKPDLKVV